MAIYTIARYQVRSSGVATVKLKTLLDVFAVVQFGGYASTDQ